MGNLNTPLTPTHKPCSQKINKEAQALNGTTNQSGLTDTYRTFYPNVAKHTFFSRVHEMFTKIQDVFIAGCKASFSVGQRIARIPVAFQPQFKLTKLQLKKKNK